MDEAAALNSGQSDVPALVAGLSENVLAEFGARTIDARADWAPYDHPQFSR
jgi:hypothetical protein